MFVAPRLRKAKLLEKEFSLRGVLRSVHEYARRIVAAEQIEGGLTIDPATQMPTGITGKIVLKEPSSDWKARGFASMDNLFLTLKGAGRKEAGGLGLTRSARRSFR
jgi:hypothetical protein